MWEAGLALVAMFTGGLVNEISKIRDRERFLKTLPPEQVLSLMRPEKREQWIKEQKEREARERGEELDDDDDDEEQDDETPEEQSDADAVAAPDADPSGA